MSAIPSYRLTRYLGPEPLVCNVFSRYTFHRLGGRVVGRSVDHPGTSDQSLHGLACGGSGSRPRDSEVLDLEFYVGRRREAVPLDERQLAVALETAARGLAGSGAGWTPRRRARPRHCGLGAWWMTTTAGCPTVSARANSHSTKARLEYPLGGWVQINDAYWGRQRRGGKRGRGAPGKTPFVAAVDLNRQWLLYAFRNPMANCTAQFSQNPPISLTAGQCWSGRLRRRELPVWPFCPPGRW